MPTTSNGVRSTAGWIRRVPRMVAGVAVEAVREDWVVEDRWWTPKAVRRRYFELVLEDGRDVTIFCELGRRRWFAQRT